jgi:hypothetical protein
MYFIISFIHSHGKILIPLKPSTLTSDHQVWIAWPMSIITKPYYKLTMHIEIIKLDINNKRYNLPSKTKPPKHNKNHITFPI